MPSSNGLSSVPGSLSTTSTNVAVGRHARATAEARRDAGFLASASRAVTLTFGATPPATTRAAAAEGIAEWGLGRLVRGKKPSLKSDRDGERACVPCRAGARARKWAADAIRNPHQSRDSGEPDDSARVTSVVADDGQKKALLVCLATFFGYGVNTPLALRRSSALARSSLTAF